MMKLALVGWFVAWCLGFVGLILAFGAIPGWLHVLLAVLLAFAAPPVREILRFLQTDK